ncbi:hypothetical protein [Bailinhaonella thermotolerans]|uniref:Secreted protein n=1 Tax=Bailinhaonella thermotolerans TaxID=1070861 RepID=A0A3A4B6R5_9ACTN|nr:hypothetical protein [Bailinhaonella thermotolerans]RJL34257.1 hypothetical protein D5H75_07285 [Bailinhaonella thermotolerans]
MRTLLKPLFIPLLLAGVSLSGTAACASSPKADGVASAGGGTAAASASPSAQASSDPRDDQLKFAQCMRENGVNMPDPDPDDGKVRIHGNPGNRDAVQKALKKCEKHMQGGGRRLDPSDPAVRDQMVKFARCMRQHGINMPDPEPGSRGHRIEIKKGEEAKFEQASKACEKYAPGKLGKSSEKAGGS